MPGWWQRYGDLLPSWFETYVAMEHAASVIRTYEVQFVPGLLQTDEYARTVLCTRIDPPEDSGSTLERIRTEVCAAS